MYIESERIILREFCEEDLNDLQEIFGDDETMENCEQAYTIERTLEFLKEFCIKKKYAFASVDKKTGKMIGYILFKPYGDPEVYEIGWIFNKNFWGKGYAYETCSELIRYALGELKVHKIIAEAIDKVKSVGLMKKLGMNHEGTQIKQTKDLKGHWVDLYFYGILKEDFEESKIH